MTRTRSGLSSSTSRTVAVFRFIIRSFWRGRRIRAPSFTGMMAGEWNSSISCLSRAWSRRSTRRLPARRSSNPKIDAFWCPPSEESLDHRGASETAWIQYFGAIDEIRAARFFRSTSSGVCENPRTRRNNSSDREVRAHDLFAQLADRAAGDDRAAIHDVKLVGKLAREIEILLDEQDAHRAFEF
jgi:hypothetical protein